MTDSNRVAIGESSPMLVIDSIVGATLLIRVLLHILVAVTLPTSSYLAVSRLVGLGTLAAGLLVLITYARRIRRGS